MSYCPSKTKKGFSYHASWSSLSDSKFSINVGKLFNYIIIALLSAPPASFSSKATKSSTSFSKCQSISITKFSHIVYFYFIAVKSNKYTDRLAYFRIHIISMNAHRCENFSFHDTGIATTPWINVPPLDGTEENF